MAAWQDLRKTIKETIKCCTNTSDTGKNVSVSVFKPNALGDLIHFQGRQLSKLILLLSEKQSALKGNTLLPLGE